MGKTAKNTFHKMNLNMNIFIKNIIDVKFEARVICLGMTYKYKYAEFILEGVVGDFHL